VFDRIVSKFRNVIRTAGAISNAAPWLVPVAILAFVLIW
jgi:hypothetical protein